MIRNDAELEVVRKQLRRAEAALDACRRDFLPHNEVQYRMFADSTIDLIQSIRGEIDVYLGIAPDADLSVSLEGADVSLGQTSAGVITRTIDTFRRGLQSVVGALHATSEAGATSRRANWIERLCDLSLAGVGPGSVRVHLDLPAAADGGLVDDADRRLLSVAVTTLFDGLEWAAVKEGAVPPSLGRLSLPLRLSVFGAVARLLPPQAGPVERIAYRRRPGPEGPPRAATLTRESRQRVHQEMERLAPGRQLAEAEGVIRQIDLDTQTFVLRERLEGRPVLPCEYPGTLADTAKELLDRRVRVSGLLETSRVTQRPKLEAEAIEAIDGDEQAESERGAAVAAT